MRILMVGAGIIGRTYAVHLHQAGLEVDLLVREGSYYKLQAFGIQIHDILNKQKLDVYLPLVTEDRIQKIYDLVILSVRLEQLTSTFPFLLDLHPSTAILFMLNNIKNIDSLADIFPNRKILLGFPGIGGRYREDTIEYIIIKEQKTTIGNLHDKNCGLASKVKILFEKAGFKTVIEKDMQSWLLTHAVFICSLSAYIVKNKGSGTQLAKNKAQTREWLQVVAEGFKALQKAGFSIVPKNIKTIFLKVPTWFALRYWQKHLQGSVVQYAIEPHTAFAKKEMQLLSKDLLTVLDEAKKPAPKLEAVLSEFINQNGN